MIVYIDAQVLTNYTYTYSGRYRLYADVETILKWSDTGACQTLAREGVVLNRLHFPLNRNVYI